MKTTEYQVCAINKDAKTATVLEIISAVSLQAAVELVNAKHKAGTVRVYPLVTLDNPDSITEMARFTLASVENWERRNNYAVMNPIKRNQWDKEDYTSIATVAILETLAANPDATMFDVKSAAFSAIRTYQQRQDRNSEREYNPGWITCNVLPRGPRSSCPALDRLMKKAIDAADLTEAQREVFRMSYNEDMSAASIAEMTGKTRRKVYSNLYRAYYWVILKAAELDGDGLDTFRRAGYTGVDVAEILVTLRKRGGMNKNQK